MAAIISVRYKMANKIIQFVVLLHIIDLYVDGQPTVETPGQAFVQTDNELRYMVDGINFQILGNKKGEVPWDDTSTDPVLFEPPLLDFDEQAIGMPHLEKVTIHNADTFHSLHLLSISGSTPHFHCSFFQEKHVPPGANTTFEVVFLARKVGNVENTLNIHTSVGTFKYQVFGVGIANPYRVRPLLGAKVAINTSFSPLIHLHNPHSSTLQVEEIYSSGGDLHIQLPMQELETKHLWEIPPYDTKAIMKATFLGRVENNHTAFIRIKTSKEMQENVLVLPIEVEVNEDPGIFSSLDKLDFGLVRSSDPPKTIELKLYSSRGYPVPIHEVYVAPYNDAIQIDFHPTFLKQNLYQASTVARISFNASRAKQLKQSSGVIVVKSKTEALQHVIPFQATVLHGYLFYDQNKTCFYTGQPNKTISQNLPITNMFNFSLAIHNVSIADDKAAYFTFGRFDKPMVIKSGDTKIPFVIHFNLNETGLHFKTYLLLHTNASIFYIPVHAYNGKVKVIHHRPEIFRGQLDFGTVDTNTEYSLLVTLRNDNPINIFIQDFKVNLERSSVKFLGMEAGNGTALKKKSNSSELSGSITLLPNHYAVFNVTITTRDEESSLSSVCIINTQFEKVQIPLTLQTVEGSLQKQPKVILMKNCFPGKVCRQYFSVNSSFNRYMKINQVIFRPDDNRFSYSPPSSKNVVLEPLSQSDLGEISFDIQQGLAGCLNDCYVGLPLNIPAGRKWLQAADLLTHQTADIDEYLCARARRKWAALQEQQQNVINATVQVDTNEIRGFLFHAQAHLSWPALVKRSRINFPLTQIGNTSVHELLLENPSDVPVIVQVLPLIFYPSPGTVLSLVESSSDADLNAILDSSGDAVFTVRDLDPHHRHYNYTRRERRRIEKAYGVKAHASSMIMTINASSSVKLHIGFTPLHNIPMTSLILIRNNLTILETVVVQGTGQRGDMRFGNKKTGSTLVFEVTEKNCDKKKSTKSSIPSFSVKNGFPVRNTGKLPFYVTGFIINDRQCEGYGFKVIDCNGFYLAPNDSKTVTIAFTPDFSVSRTQRTLTIQTSLAQPINFTLQSTMPPHLLSKCAAALPRPPWEPVLYYTSVTMMVFVLLCIFAAAYLEAIRIYDTDQIRTRIKNSVSQLQDLTTQSAGESINSSKVFDLNNLDNDKTMTNGSSSSGGGAGDCHPPRLNGVLNTSKKAELFASGYTPVNNHPRPASARSRRRDNNPSPNMLMMLFYKLIGHLRGSWKWPSVKWKGWFKYAKTTEQQRKSNRSSTVPYEKESKVSPTTSASTKDNGNNKTDTSQQQQSLNQTWTNNRHASGAGDAGENTRQTRQQKQHKYSKLQYTTDLMDEVAIRTGGNNKRSNQDDNTNKQNDRKKSNELTNGIDTIESRSGKPELYYTDQKDKRTQRSKKDGGIYPERRVPWENDDSASTTTESSIELEDKAQGTSGDPLVIKGKRTRTKASKKKDEDEYIIGSKSRMHKRIISDLGGDILTPSSLELPYKMEGDSPKPIKNDPLLGGRRQRSRNKRNNTIPFNFNLLEETNQTLPVWDQPKPVDFNDDFNEMSHQTQLFAAHKVNGVAAGGGAGTVNEALSMSSRSSSYSSVVSNGSENKINGKENKISSLSPISIEARAPGSVIGSQSFSPVHGAAASSRNQQLLTTNDSQLSPGNSFGLEPITERDTAISNGFPNTNAPIFTSQAGSEALHTFSGVTMMQRLMADRRKRQEEYEQRRLSEKWPFFDTNTNLPANALWDSTSPTGNDTWSVPGSSPPHHDIWQSTTLSSSNPPGAPGQGWGNTASIWSNPTTVSAAETVGSIGDTVMRGGGQAVGSPAYDPFNNLWNPTGFGVPGQAHNWSSFTPPKPDEN